MIHDIFMPALSSTMTEGKIVEWLKSPGDKIKKGETVLIVESDKADMDVEAFEEGYLAAILVEAGQEAPVGSTIALIAETEAEIEEAKRKAAALTGNKTTTSSSPQPAQKTKQKTSSSTPAEIQTPVSTLSRGNGRVIASPRAKKLAKQLGVDLKTIQGSGIHGRIVGTDVEKAAGKAPTVKTPATPVVTTQLTPPPPQPSPQPVIAGETVPFNTLQKAVVQNMMASLQLPTFHVSYSITTDALERLYQQIKSKGVTMTGLLAKAVAVTLVKHPIVNASYTDSGIHYNKEINIAVAVAMPDGGLITPVLRQADQVDIYSLSRSWKDLVNRARAKQLQPDEYSTGTFTLSNLGMFGVERFDAILPPGQGSILAIGSSRPQVVASDDGLFGIKKQMVVNITADHRIIYGADAAAFLKDLAELIETKPESLTL